MSFGHFVKKGAPAIVTGSFSVINMKLVLRCLHANMSQKVFVKVLIVKINESESVGGE